MHSFLRTAMGAIFVLGLCVLTLPACPGTEGGNKPASPAADSQDAVNADSQDAANLDEVVKLAEENLPKLRLSMGSSRETKIEVLGAVPTEIPGVVKLKLRVTREERTAIREVLVSADLKYAFIGVLQPLGKIPRQRVVLDNVDLAGLPVRGQPDAPITLVEYSDFQCPYCKASQPQIERLLREYDGKIKLIYKHYPLKIHDWAWEGALLSECARKQKPELFWKLHDFYYTELDRITRQNLLPRTQSILADDGIDMEAFNQCFLDQEPADLVRKSIDEGKTIGVKGTPAFLVNDVFMAGLLQYEVMSAIVQEELGEDWLDEEG